jgi:6,7-dimethyl-8-ribityllumazine synthase
MGKRAKSALNTRISPMAAPDRTAPHSVPHTHAHLLIVEARFYQGINDALLEGATLAINESGATADHVVVPGALEIPAAIAILVSAAAKKGKPYDGAVALGCVIRGETTHYELVSGESARALMDLSVSQHLPLGNGILTVENEAQAWVRAKRSELDKGGDAARAALAMIRLKRQAEGL